MNRVPSARWLILVLCMVAGALAGPADASVIVYTSEAAFAGATTGMTTTSFDGIAAPGTFVSYGGGPLGLPAATFTGNSSMFVIDPGWYGFAYPSGGFLNSDYSSPNQVTATLSSPATAVGVNYGSLFAGGATFTFLLSTGDSFTLTTGGSTQVGLLGFAGFTSTTPITSIQFTMPDSPYFNAIDNFQTGTAVPEPGTLLLLGSGVAALAARRRRKA